MTMTRGRSTSAAYLPDAVGGGFEAVLGVDDDEGGLDGEHGGAGFVEEHVEAGGVDEVDLDAVPLGEGDGVGHGGAAADLFFVVGGDGGAIFYTAARGGHFGGVEQDGDEGRFAAVGVAHDGDVANVLAQIGVHVALLSCFRRRSRGELCAGGHIVQSAKRPASQGAGMLSQSGRGFRGY